MNATSTDNLKSLLEETLGFLAICTCQHANSNPKGRMNANDLLVRIQKSLGRTHRPVISATEIVALEKEWLEWACYDGAYTDDPFGEDGRTESDGQDGQQEELPPRSPRNGTEESGGSSPRTPADDFRVSGTHCSC